MAEGAEWKGGVRGEGRGSSKVLILCLTQVVSASPIDLP